MHFNAWKRPLLSLAGLALAMCIGPPKANAQWDPDFSAFTNVTFVSGYQFTIGGQNISNFISSGGGLNLSAINSTNGLFQFGFSTTGNPNGTTPITLDFSAGTGSNFGLGSGGGTDTITGIDAVALVADGNGTPVTATEASTAQLSNYSGSADGIFKPTLLPNGSWPMYGAVDSSGNLDTWDNGNYLRNNTDVHSNSPSSANQAYGQYSFTNIQTNGATTPVYFAIDVRDSNGNTGWVLFDTPAPVPEPAFFQLGGLLALSGLGSACRRLRKRRAA